MSQETVNLIRRAHDAASRGDQEGFMDMFAEDVVWDQSRSDFPDKGIYHGHEGVREWMSGLEDAFDDLDREVEEITDLGQDRVLVVMRMKGHGQFSKIAVDYRFVPMYTFRDGKVVRMDRYGDRAEALKAVGLRE
jgi:ketosteroid isomerase-like protein